MPESERKSEREREIKGRARDKRSEWKRERVWVCMDKKAKVRAREMKSNAEKEPQDEEKRMTDRCSDNDFAFALAVRACSLVPHCWNKFSLVASSSVGDMLQGACQRCRMHE